MNLSLSECGKERTDRPNYIGDDHYQLHSEEAHLLSFFLEHHGCI